MYMINESFHQDENYSPESALLEKIGALCFGSSVLFAINSFEHFKSNLFSFDGGEALALGAAAVAAGLKAIRKAQEIHNL